MTEVKHNNEVNCTDENNTQNYKKEDKDIFEGNRSDRRTLNGQIAITASLFLTLAISAVFIAVYMDREEDEPSKLQEQSTQPECNVDDVVIVGAGIAGTYAAWRLRDQNLSVTIYEYSNRVGGRMQTVHMPGASDINIELGAMRFIPLVHPLMNATAHALQLPVVDYDLGNGAFSDIGMAYLRGVHTPIADLGGPGTPYKLRESERNRTSFKLAFDLFKTQTTYNGMQSLADADAMHLIQTKDGYPLYKQSAQEAYIAMGVSQEAIRFMRDAYGFYARGGDVSAAAVIPNSDPSLFNGISVKTLRSGMETLPRELLQQVMHSSKRHRVRMNAALRRINRRPDDSYSLTFLETQTTNGYTTYVKDGPELTACAKTVLLGIPRFPLEEIEWTGLRIPDVQNYIKHAVKDVPVLKIYLAYSTPWWRNTELKFSHSVTDLPIQKTYDFGTSTQSNVSILLAAYTDKHEAVSLLQKAQSRGRTSRSNHQEEVDDSIGVTDHLVGLTHNFLAELYNISMDDIPAPLGGAIANWGEYPYGAGWYKPMPGFLQADVLNRMVQPSGEDEVYIMTNAFSKKGSHWAESALEMVELALKKAKTVRNKLSPVHNNSRVADIII